MEYSFASTGMPVPHTLVSRGRMLGEVLSVDRDACDYVFYHVC
jgi:hypothetical protein